MFTEGGISVVNLVSFGLIADSTEAELEELIAIILNVLSSQEAG